MTRLNPADPRFEATREDVIQYAIEDWATRDGVGAPLAGGFTTLAHYIEAALTEWEASDD